MSMVATTLIYPKPETAVMTYHSTEVARLEHGVLTLNTGGWSTYTTKRRMNQFFDAVGLDMRVFQKNWVWYVEDIPTGKTWSFSEDKLVIELW